MPVRVRPRAFHPTTLHDSDDYTSPPAGDCCSFRRVQSLVDIQGWQPSDRRPVLTLREPQLESFSRQSPFPSASERSANSRYQEFKPLAPVMFTKQPAFSSAIRPPGKCFSSSTATLNPILCRHPTMPSGTFGSRWP